MDDRGIKLSHKEKVLIMIAIANTASITFGGYFIAKWTVSLTGNVTDLIWQFCIQIIPTILVYFFTLKILHTIKLSTMFAVSFVFYSLAYTVFYLLVTQGRVFEANIAYGIVFGVGGGIFWGCNNNLSVAFTNHKSRVKYLAYNGAFSMGIALFSNVAIIMLMMYFGGEKDIPDIVYTFYFLATVAFYLIAGALSLTLKIARYPAQFKLSRLKQYNEPSWKKYLTYCVFYGIHNGLPDAILGVTLIAFTRFSNYFYLWMVVLSIGIKVIANYMFKSKLIYKHRFSSYVFFSIVASLNLLALALTYTIDVGGYVALFVLLANSFVLIIRTQSETMINLEVISNFVTSDVELSGRFFSRELAITVGKAICAVIMLATTLLFKENVAMVILVILAYALASVFSVTIVGKNFKAILDADKIYSKEENLKP